MSVYRTIEDMKKDNKKFSMQLQREMNDLRKVILREKRIIVLIFIMVLFLIIVYFKLNVGIWYINVYTYHEGYKVTINNENLSYAVIEDYKQPILPYFIELYNDWNSAVYVKNPHQMNNTLLKGSSYILSIKEYKCYSEKLHHIVSCDCTRDFIKKNSKYKKTYTNFNNYKLLIKDGNQKEIYSGVFINNISKYLKREGHYYIQISGNQDSVKFTINVNLDIVSSLSNEQ